MNRCLNSGCRLYEGQEAVKHCPREQCGLSLTLKGPDRFKRKMRAHLTDLITADVLYQAYTGEEDIYKLDKIRALPIDHPVVLNAEKQWQQRLRDLEEKRQQEAEESRQAVQQYTLGIF